MKVNIYFIAVTMITVLIGQSVFAGFKDAKLAFKAGNWSVYRSIDPMKDTVDCTGVYKENYGIQLTDNTLFVSVEGGLKSVTLRFGDKPARDLRLASSMEKRVGSIIISGQDFAELLESQRLRVQASTLIRGLANEDLDLSGLSEAVENIKAECPVQSASTVRRGGKKASACSETLIGRLRGQGLEEREIVAICYE